MTDSFGARLRRRREEQGIALAAIAEQTKIKSSLLEALERGDVRHWPSGIFRRAFIRAYAEAIGLDPDAIVREFLDLYPEPDELAAAATLMATTADDARSNGAPPTRLRQMVGSAIGSLGRFRRTTPAQETPAAGAAPRREAPPVEAPAAAESRFPVASPALWDAANDVALDRAVTPPEEAVEPVPTGAGLLLEQPHAVAIEPAGGEPHDDAFAGRDDRHLAAAGEPRLDPRSIDVPTLDEAAPAPQAAASARPRDDQPPAETRVEPAADVRMMDRAEPDPASFVPDFLAVANLCTEFARVEDAQALRPLVQRATEVLDAAGLIVWIWDGIAEQLRPALVHGYSERVIAQLPAVAADADNATAAAFRSAQPCAISASDHTCSALVVPLLTPGGCAGVLAIELPPGRERSLAVRAAATIFAAVLAQLAGGAAAEAHDGAPRMPIHDVMRPRVGSMGRFERAYRRPLP